ncbi:MAG: hypothetical protein WED87_07785 [Dehalococcoidia bacterium]
MTETEQTCPDCGVAFELADNYCRQCGMYVAALRTLTTVPPQSLALEPARTGLPTPVNKAATAVAVGTALQLAVGLTGKYLARQAARQAVASVRPTKPVVARKRALEKANGNKPVVVDDPMEGVTAVSETLIIQRTWMRRRP